MADLQPTKAQQAMQTAGNVVKRPVKFANFLESSESVSKASKWARSAAGFGIIIGAGMGILSNQGMPLIIGYTLLGGIVGFFAGFLLGLFMGLFPEGVSNVLTILAFFIAVYLFLGTGLGGPIYAETGPIRESGWEGIKQGATCIANPKVCLFEPFYKGWGEETKEQDVSLTVSFDTNSVYDDGKDKKIQAEINVMNKPIDGIESFYIEPECYIDEKKVDVEIDGYKEDEKLAFLARDISQQASIKCIVPSDLIAGKEDIKAKIKLIRPVKSKVEWTLTTLSSKKIKEILNKNEKLPGENDVNGVTVKYSGVPYSFGIGTTTAMPLPEGEYNLNIEFKKRSDLTGKLIGINKLEVSGIGETAHITECTNLQSSGDKFALESKGITETQFECKFEVIPEDDENQVIFDANAEYNIEIEETKGVMIFKENA